MVKDQQSYYSDYLKQKKSNEIIAEALLYKFNEANQNLSFCLTISPDVCNAEESMVNFYESEFTNFRIRSISFSLGERMPAINLMKLKTDFEQSLTRKEVA